MFSQSAMSAGDQGHSPLLFGVRSVVILRALQFGDLMCAVPALRALRAALPEASITLVGLPWAREFVRRFNTYLDGFIEFPGYPGLPERQLDTLRIPSFLDRIQERGFDLSIQMHGSGSFVNPLVALFAARRSAGFYISDDYVPDSRWYMRYPEEGHEILRLLELVGRMGCAARGTALEFPLESVDRTAGAALLKECNLIPRHYVIVHPGGRGPDRRWPVARFAEAGRLLQRHDMQIVLTGTAEERGLTARLAFALGKGAVNLTARTSIGTLAYLIAHARLLVANDTGVSHIAAAFGTPSAIVFTGTDPRRWAPLRSDLHCAVNGMSADAEEVLIRYAETQFDKRIVSDAAA